MGSDLPCSHTVSHNQLSQSGCDRKADMNKLLVPPGIQTYLFKVPENLTELFRQRFSMAYFYPLFSEPQVATLRGYR